MGLAWMLEAAVAAVLASWAFNALVHLVWRPYAITRRLRGPDYRFLTGNLGEMKAPPRRRRPRHAGRRRPRLHPHGAAAPPQVDRALRPDVRVLERGDAERVRGGRERGQAGALRPHRALPQEPHEPTRHPPARQGPRPHRRRRLEAPPQGRAPGLQHGQAQDDDGDHVRLRSVHDVRVGGAAGQGRWRRGGGGRDEQPVRGAHRRRDLAHGVREQLRGGETGLPGAEGAPVPGLLHFFQCPDPSVQVPPDREEPQDMEAGQAGAGHAHGHHQAPPRQQGHRRLRERPARAHAGGVRAGARRDAGAEHGRDHRRLQDILLRRARHHLPPAHLGRVPVEHAPGMAGQAPGGGAATRSPPATGSTSSLW